MQYPDYEYTNTTAADEAPWEASPQAPNPAVPPPRTVQIAPPLPTPVPVTAASSTAELMVLGNLIQSVQQTQTQQLYLLRDMDSRLARLEVPVRYVAQPAAANPAPAPMSYERATWWAIWGLLMLILGGALAVVTLLILLNVRFR